ncbi:MAG: DUF1934 domain-containing protein [Clostridiales bacterium]|nr:DUF1934 domain-containing protein [Clostridiales bacterium]
MTKDVMVHIRGVSLEEENGVPVEVTAQGQYYYKNFQHVVFYQDPEGEHGGGKNMLKITPEKMVMKKSGHLETIMEFQPGKEHLCDYRTPYGTMKVHTNTSRYDVTEREHSIEIQMEYGLSMNGAYVSACRLNIMIESKK